MGSEGAEIETMTAGRRTRLILLGLAVLYAAGGTWALWQAHRPSFVPLRFEDLTRYHAGDRRTDRAISTHAYVRWSKDKADASKQGVTRHDRERAWAGYNVFTDDRQHALLVDMDGTIVYSWTWEGARWLEYALVGDDGSLLGMSVQEGVVRLDKDSNAVWVVRCPAHHEIAIAPGRRIIVPTKRLFDLDRIGLPTKKVALDEMILVTLEGEQVGHWSAATHIDALRKLHGPSPAETDEEDDYYHLNSVQVLPDTPLGRRDPRFQVGNFLLCMRNVNLIVILDRETMAPVWGWGTDVLDYPHMPRMLEGGTILVYDNGTHRGSSRILEIDPPTGEVVWRYEASDFFSAYRGSSQRLPNGNTLICQSDSGRAFEVDRDGQIVWEFWNPIMDGAGRRRGIYRLHRIAPEQVAGFLPRRVIRWGWIVGAAVPLLLLLAAAVRFGGRRAADGAPER